MQVFFDGLADDAERYRRRASAVADGLAASGIEFELVLGFTDQDEFVPPSPGDVPAAAAGLAAPQRGMDADEFLAVFDAYVAERPATIGPIAAQWCSDRALEGIAARVRDGVRVHTHLLESRAQRETLVPSPVERLRTFGLLCDRLSAAHAVWLTPEEIAECAAAGAVLVHCPGSNRKLAGAVAPTRAWLDAGVTAALGLDSYPRVEPADAFDELRLARDALGARDALALATLGGAAARGPAGARAARPGLRREPRPAGGGRGRARRTAGLDATRRGGGVGARYTAHARRTPARAARGRGRARPAAGDAGRGRRPAPGAARRGRGARALARRGLVPRRRTPGDRGGELKMPGTGAAAALHFTHCSLAVHDLDTAVGFYTEAFGCTVAFRADGMTDLIRSVAGQDELTCDLAILNVPGSEVLLELIAFRRPGAAVDHRPPGGHVEFSVADLEASLAAVERLGARRVGAVTEFPEGPSVYCTEPGGSVFELTEYRS